MSSDELNFQKKGRFPVYDQCERMAVIAGVKYVNAVFLEGALVLKARFIQKYNAATLVMGDDWKGKFEHFSSMANVIYLGRTPTISTTSLIDVIKRR